MKSNLPMRLRGFSLIEVLVALLIIGVGMLGIAKIQAMAYASTGTASLRSIAAIEAAGLAANMRANRGYWTVVPGGFTTTITGSSSSTASVAVSDATVPAVAATNCNYPATCTPAQIAGFDLWAWAQVINAALPSASALITCPAAAAIAGVAQPIACTIQMNWAERNVGINTQSQGTAQIAAPAYSYTLYVEP